MINSNILKPGVLVSDLPVILLLDDEAFMATTNLHYTAKQGKSGAAASSLASLRQTWPKSLLIESATDGRNRTNCAARRRQGFLVHPQALALQNIEVLFPSSQPLAQLLTIISASYDKASGFQFGSALHAPNRCGANYECPLVIR